ncbi:MAG TPA: oxidoreductase [Bacteroidetes bacterium]|nr:oxidoreductase [Bacteroidota bacterium]
MYFCSPENFTCTNRHNETNNNESMNNQYYKITGRRDLTDTTFVLEIERKGMAFEPGQHLLLGKAGDIHHREYSIYSGNKDQTLDVLVKEVENGEVSKTLKHLQPGDQVEVQGPLGFFTLEEDFLKNGSRFLFVASGTGISPFHSMVKSLPQLDYTLLHGIRYAEEAYDRQDYQPQRYVACTSRDEKGDFHGRVTDYIRQHDFDNNTHCYLCGNFEMIREAMDLLEKKGIAADHLHAEVYF